MADGAGVWVYAVAESELEGSRALTGVGGARVRTLEVAGLTAILSDVDLSEFGEDALHRKLEDLAWLEETARAHHDVIEAVADAGPLVPMRLATVYTSEASARDALGGRSAQIRATLRRLRGHAEWGVKAFVVPRDKGSSPGPGTETGIGYLQRRREELSARHDRSGDALVSAQAVHSVLSTYATQTRLHPPQAPRLSGSSSPMVLNAAYLLANDRTESFTAAVETLTERHQNLRLGLTGPWPPYSFTGFAGFAGEEAPDESG